MGHGSGVSEIEPDDFKKRKFCLESKLMILKLLGTWLFFTIYRRIPRNICQY